MESRPKRKPKQGHLQLTAKNICCFLVLQCTDLTHKPAYMPAVKLSEYAEPDPMCSAQGSVCRSKISTGYFANENIGHVEQP